MQKYWWPGYEMQLLGELQRQQNSALFCDTLLEAEGISVPTHSCVLAALSPYLSQKLLASPPPPSGQRHQLQLQAVKAQTLLKLVGLLYSGELEVKGSVEENDVLAVARQFGIADLVEGRKDGGVKRRCLGRCGGNDFHAVEGRGRDEGRTTQDAQVQAEMAGRRGTDSPGEKKSCISTGTQTVTCGEKSVGSPLPSPSAPPTPESSPAVAQHLDLSAMLPQTITLDEQICSTSCQVVPSMLSGTPSDGESPYKRFSAHLMNSTSTPALSSDMLTFPISADNDSDSPRPQEDGTYRQSPEFEDGNRVLAEERTEPEGGKRIGKMADGRGDAEQPSQADREEMPGEDRGKSAERRHPHSSAGMKSLAKMKHMQQMMETTQISIKVKLRRRTTGEVWEVVSLQDSDKPVALLPSLKQDGSNHRKPETDYWNLPPSHPAVQPVPTQRPDCRILQPATTNSTKAPPLLHTSSDSQPLSRDCFTPNQQEGLAAAPLPQCQGSVEECDEQIEKLLEDIMMGLNILPGCRKPHHLQPSQDGAPTILQVPVTESDAGHSQMLAAAGAAGCVFYQDLGTRSCHLSIDRGMDCFRAQNQPSCSSFSSVLADAALMLQQQEPSPQYESSVRAMWQRDGVSCQSAPLSRSQENLHPEAPATRPVIPSAFFSIGQKLHYPAFQDLSSQDNQHILELLPLTNGDETSSIQTLSSSCLEDLRLPQCLSPLELCTSSTKHQPALNTPTNPSNKTLQQPSLHGRPWLTANPGSLQVALSTHRKNKNVSLPQDANGSSWLKQWQEHLELNPQKGGTRAGSCAAKEQRQPNAPGLKSDPRNVKEGDTAGAVAPKRRKTKCRSHLQDAAGSLLPYKDVKASDGTTSPISLSICQVSLSRNNVLAKEREMATSSFNIPSKFVGKPNQPPPITESLKKKIRGSGVKTDQTRIRTRGFLKKTQESTSDTSTKNSTVSKTVNKQGIESHKRGRRTKTKLEELTPPKNNPAVVEKKCNSKEGQQDMDNSSPKEDLGKGDATKRRCRKRWLNRSAEGAVVPLKKSISVESSGRPEAGLSDVTPDVRKLETPRRMVTLKEFQKLVKRQHSNMRRSRGSQDTNAESEGMASRDRTSQESAKETDMGVDVARPQDTDRSVAVDENHNQIFSESTGQNNGAGRDDADGSACKESGSFGGEDYLVSSFDALEEEVAKLAAGRERAPKNPDEAGLICESGVLNTAQQTAIHDQGFTHSAAHLPQEDKPPSPDKPETTGPPLSGAGGISRSSGCTQEEEEKEEEEEEVDVVLYSPVRLPQPAQCEDGLSITERTPDEEEEEEEDVNEIDVTGDEEE